ncbi:hypothetical protein GCM10023088_15510 [Actinomadura verrucosospora]
MTGGGPGVAAVDWQTLTVGLPARALVAACHRALAGHGVTGYSLEQCRDDYVFAFTAATARSGCRTVPPTG